MDDPPAGARLTSWNSVACELQRDWNRSSTVEGFRRNAIDHRTAWGWYLAMESGTAAGKD
ncbi:hypothetical protein [Streptomyces sp. NPDC017524]|uniref:hypothetical protein n=1 Tax=unclassified Streptomyces TaxID=2593676 RepID=UPI0037BD899C